MKGRVLTGLIVFLVSGAALSAQITPELLKEAEGGNVNAQRVLGWTYELGVGVNKDAAEAVKWYRKAAEQGVAGAQNNLGYMYKDGDGVIKDLVEAHAWFNVAGANGVDGAKNNLKIIEKNMTREQIAEATALARKRFEMFRKKE